MSLRLRALCATALFLAPALVPSRLFTAYGQTPVVFASPASLAAGGAISVSWKAPAGSSVTDWIGLYRASQVPGQASSISYEYTNGATSGAVTFFAPATAGQYVFFYCLNDGYTCPAKTGLITVTAATGAPTLAVTPASVPPAGNVSVSWTAPAGSSATDWVGLYRSDQTPGQVGSISFKYTGGAAAGTFNFTAPAASGDYVFFYCLNDGYACPTKSSVWKVQQVPTLTVVPGTVPTSASFTVSWSAPAGSTSSRDSLILLPAGVVPGQGTPIWSRATNGAASGTVTVPSPGMAGSFVFHYSLNNRFMASAPANVAFTQPLPTGMRITPTAAPGALFMSLNPDVPGAPNFLAGHAVSTAISPDGKTLLILTSGFNLWSTASGNISSEYVFVYDIAGGSPLKRQVIAVPNTFNGLAWNPDGREFYVAGGKDNNVHVYEKPATEWTRTATIALPAHPDQNGYYQPMAAGLGVNSTGDRLVVANLLYDSVSVVNLRTRVALGDVDLRPGVVDPSKAGTPGGTYPFWVTIKGADKAYVSSQRDGELVVLDLLPTPRVTGRIRVGSLPSRIALNSTQTMLMVAEANSDSVAVIDTATDRIIENIVTTAPATFLNKAKTFKGSSPNSIAMSPDGLRLYVTNGGTNSVAVLDLKADKGTVKGRLLGLIPTGYYPHSVSLSADGRWLYIVNGKSVSGPNAKCGTTGCDPGNTYNLQLEKAGFLALPVPSNAALATLTQQVAENNRLTPKPEDLRNQQVMSAVKSGIQHVIYVMKENRTYDEIFGDLPRGNGDPNLAILGPYMPNHRKLAMDYVLLDNFHDSGAISPDGWNWTLSGRTTDYLEKTVSLNYAGRGFTYDWEGENRNVDVSLGTLAERKAAKPTYPNDPNLLPGTSDVSAPDGPANEIGEGYLWDSALRGGKSIRMYGMYCNYGPYDPAYIRNPRSGPIQAVPRKRSLKPHTDPYFRNYDMRVPDFWLFKEWEREFNGFVANRNLPNLSFVYLPHDHTGSFGSAMDGVNTVERQMADNDYALGLLVEKVAKSPYKDNTLIFVVEDDSQGGVDHVDGHRSLALIIGPHVKRGQTISKHYTTVSMVRTIVDVLGIQPCGLNDALAEPMADVFNTFGQNWTYTATVPEILYSTALPLPPKTASARFPIDVSQPVRSPEYWEKAMAGQDFSTYDHLDSDRFNRALWAGIRGEQVPYPTLRHGKDMTRNRKKLIADYWAQRLKENQ